MASFIEELLTFGNASRVEKAIDAYNRLHTRATALAERVERQRVATNNSLKRVVRSKVRALKVLRRVDRVCKNIGAREREFLQHQIDTEQLLPALSRVESTIDAGASAMAAAKGASAGVSTALGAWALAGSIGTASTGTAIASLSGAAATNATLAWFGGGSLAAGGLGTAGGAAVLGGIILVPALIITAFFARASADRKIEQITRECMKLDQAMKDMEQHELLAKALQSEAEELIETIDKGEAAFKHELRATTRLVHPWGIISRVWRWIKSKVSTRPYYDEAEMCQIQYMLLTAVEFARLIDKPLLRINSDES